MANTFTVSHEDVFGAVRVRVGTLTLTDGPGTSTTYLASTGFNSIVFAVDNSISQCRISHSAGNIGVATHSSSLTLASGATMEVMIFGS